MPDAARRRVDITARREARFDDFLDFHGISKDELESLPDKKLKALLLTILHAMEYEAWAREELEKRLIRWSVEHRAGMFPVEEDDAISENLIDA